MMFETSYDLYEAITFAAMVKIAEKVHSKKQTLHLGDILRQFNILTSHLLVSKCKMYFHDVKCDVSHYCKELPTT